MFDIAQLLLLTVVIVAASIGCVIGTRRLIYWTRLDRYFIGDIIVTFAWVLPEYFIVAPVLVAPVRLPIYGGEPFIFVGTILGAAAANMLVIGILNAAWPGRAGLERVGAGRPLASAAVVLLVSCVAVAGLALGMGNGTSLTQLIAGPVVFAVFLAGLRLVYRRNPAEKPPGPDIDPLYQPGRGTLIGAIVMAGISVIALIYASLPFVELAMPWYSSGRGLSNNTYGLLVGSLTILLGLLMAVPDFILSVLDLQDKGGDTPMPRLFLSSAALITFTAIAGMDGKTLRNGFANSLLVSFGLTIFAVAVTVILLLAVPTRLSVRMRGLIVTALVLAGFAFSLLQLRH